MLGLLGSGIKPTSPVLAGGFLTAGPPGKSKARHILNALSSVPQSWPTLRPHGLQHTQLPCPSPTPRAHSDSCLSRQSVMPSSHLILCHSLLLLPPIPPSIRVFSNESVLRIRWPKYCSFSFSISPSNEHSGLISFRMDWLDLLAVQGLSSVFSSTTVQ